MKKILSLIVALLISCGCIFGLTACGGGADGASVENAYVDADGNLIIILTDGKEINCGSVEAQPYENFYFTAVEQDGETTYTVRSIGAVSDAEIVIPSTYKGKPVTAIGDNAFFQSKYISGVTIPDSVKTIGDNAFNGCANLKKVDLGNGVESLGDGAFAYCSSLEKITIPSSMRTIGASVFCDCYSLAEVNFEEGVERMGISVFTGCNALVEVSLPDSILGVFESDEFSMVATFMNCVSLRTVKVPANLEFLPQHFFNGCYSLENVVLGKKLKSVGYAAFFNNSMLKSIILPASLEQCESYSFYKLSALETVYFEGTAQQWTNIQVQRAESGGDIDHFSLARSTISDLFDSTVTVLFYSETEPADAGFFWHYAADGVTPEKW